MQDSAIPSKFPVVWASSPDTGTFRVVPTTPPAQNGAASLQKGFPLATITPIAAGGSWPFGQDFNGILNQITSWDQWQQAGGPVGYDATFSASIGGYPAGAVIQSATLGGRWTSLVDNNTSDPDTGGANWSGGVLAVGGDSGGAQFRAIGGNYGVMIRNDGSNAYLLQTASGAQTGTYNAYRPFAWNLSDGAVAIDATGAGVTFGGNATLAGAIYAAVGTGFSHVQVFTASGTFTAPAGVTLVHARVWGGGGGGGGANGTAAAAGGGGGGYAEGIYTVVSGTAYPVTVGASGAPGNGSPSAGGSGGTSSFGSVAAATGGSGGQGALSGTTNPAAGGSGFGGALNVPGLSSGGGILGSGIQLAGNGGGAFGTSNSANTTGGAGGSFPGGGGGGGATVSSANGAAGSPGLVIIQW